MLLHNLKATEKSYISISYRTKIFLLGFIRISSISLTTLVAYLDALDAYLKSDLTVV